jgi:hypothetical protein
LTPIDEDTAEHDLRDPTLARLQIQLGAGERTPVPLGDYDVVADRPPGRPGTR